MNSGYVGIDKDYFVSVKEVLNITAEMGALGTQTRVRELPPADVAEVRHGRWEGKTYKCSICGKWIDPLQGDADMNYCPNCGARMDGDNDE